MYILYVYTVTWYFVWNFCLTLSINFYAFQNYMSKFPSSNLYTLGEGGGGEREF